MTQSDNGLANDSGLQKSTHHGRLLTCRLDDLRPHPAYARHRFTVPADKLSSLAAHGERALREPLFITQDCLILDGYGRWELARQQGLSALPCLQFELSECLVTEQTSSIQWAERIQQDSPGVGSGTLAER
jgi:hypothetical protein